jgi:hypothetical protein
MCQQKGMHVPVDGEKKSAYADDYDDDFGMNYFNDLQKADHPPHF